MKRTRTAALIAAMAVSLAVAGTAVARNPHAGTHGHGHGATKTQAHGSKDVQTNGTTTAEGATNEAANVHDPLWVKGNAAPAGGTFRILALVKASGAARPLTVDAIVHFASGDVDVTLMRHGGSKGVAYHGTAPVPAAEPAGDVAIDASATLLVAAPDGAAPTAGQTLTATGSGKVVAQDSGDATDTQDATDGPDASEAPEASEAPDASETPEASEAPDASEAPEASEAPDASETPDANEDGDAESPDAHVQGEIVSAIAKSHLTQEVVTQLLAYLISFAA